MKIQDITPDTFFELAQSWPSNGETGHVLDQHSAEATSYAMDAVDKKLDQVLGCTTGELLVFDTETAGLRQPAVIQLAYIHRHADGTQTESNSLLRLPSGISIDPRAAMVHGITKKRLDQEGLDPVTEIGLFRNTVDDVMRRNGTIVGHNVGFDCRAIDYTLEFLGEKPFLSNVACRDTMKESFRHSPLRTLNNRVKNFKLDELYSHLFGSLPLWASLHNALDDVKVTLMCFDEGRVRSWW
jgi:DNA polymerase III epsilon subunit-like protein